MANKKRQGRVGREVAEYELLVAQERMRGAPYEEVAKAFGVSVAAVQKWTAAFRKDGPSALSVHLRDFEARGSDRLRQ